ncbi:MAG: hypothetical protein HXM94_00900 [Parvimonas micra]|uniref:Uncharacterized protein n=1 Tax=Parvimonas micra TaxID=33033 RepID=A0A930DZJ7_9FIRM|nr:hypothetical protein [Parvimonas micra]MBF1306333.1 hypothetical protein [Parvimonas micra]
MNSNNINEFLLEEGWESFLELLKENDTLSLIPKDKLLRIRKIFFAVRFSSMNRKKSLYDLYDLMIDNNGFGDFLLRNLKGSSNRINRKEVRSFLKTEVSDKSYRPFKEWLFNQLY